MSVRYLPIMLSALFVAGCSTATETATVGPVTASTTTTSAGVSGAAGSLGAGFTVGSITTAPVPLAEDPAVAGFLGPWTLARDGDRVCTVSLGPRAPGGELGARTERCTSVELARIASWAPAGDGLVLYDFDRRPVVALTPATQGAYEGALAGGTRLTLWR